MTPSNSPRQSSSLAHILDIARFSSLESVEAAVYEIQGVIRKDNIHLIIEDLLEERNTNLLPFVLSCLDTQQQSWILDFFPTSPKEYTNSFSERLLARLSRFFLVAPTFLSNELSLPPSQEQEIEAVEAILDELAHLEFPDDALVDTKHSQRQLKKQRRAAARSKAINPAPFRLLDVPIPTNPSEVEGLKLLLMTRQRSMLQIYVDYICSDELAEAMKEACVLPPQDVVEAPARAPTSATANEALQDTVESQVQGSVYPKVQPMRSALYFDSPEGFGDWIIVIHEGAEKELRFRHKKDQKTFDIIVKKIKELSHGHFSPDNCKRLNRNGSDAVVFEAKMTGDLRLVYQIDLVPHHDERVRQALKIFGIFTHAKMDERLWDGLANTLAGRSKEYRQRCAFRQRTPNADDHTFSPTFFPPLPEASEYTEMGSMLVDEANLLHSRFLMAKYVMLSEPLMNTMLADLDATFPHSVSSREKEIIEHPHSCYVVGRSGTGKTTTLLFKMLLVERTYQLAEPGTPKPRQVFVTQSRILAKKVKEYFKTLARALHVSTQSPDQLSELQDIAAEEEDDNIALDDIKDWYKDLPSKFSQLEDRHFPLFVTYSTLCSMLEADMMEKSPETSALVKGGADAIARTGPISHGSAAVDFDCFLKKYWPSLPEPLTKRIDPSLAFSELIGVIKGSEETLLCHPHLLPPEAYARKSEGRHTTFAAHGGQIYALYEAYAKKKKQAGARDVADRTHILLDYLNSHGIPGQKIDQLYVDEVQDNLLIDTLVLRALCLNSNGLFWAGDTAQAISAGSSFNFNELRAFQWRLEAGSLKSHLLFHIRSNLPSLQEKRLASFSPGGLLPSVNKAEIFQLAVNYRSHAGIVDCAHSVIDLINRFWPGSIDGLAREQGMSPGPQPIFFDGKGGNASVLSKYLFGDSGNRIEFGAQQCVLVRDAAAKERLKEEMGDDIGLVLTIYDSKGLEFNDVLLYNFFEDSNADFARWRVILNAIGQSSVPLPKFDNNKHASIWLDLKFLYVALTRARENVWIADVSDKGEPMREYWTNRGLIRSVTPGVDAPQLASSSTSEEWVVRGKQLFHLKKYPEAKHCFERAKKPNYVLMADAYMLKDRAMGAEPGSRRKAAFQSAGTAFRQCSETFKTRRSEYLRLSASCFREAQEFQAAAKLFLEIHYYGEAVECYLEVNMFDEAVKIVLRHRECLESSLADKTIKKAKFYYLSSADSLPSSDPQRKVHLEQGCQLFDDSEDPVEYLEDRLLSGALGDVLVAAQRLDEAAELHWSEGRVIEAITLFFESQTEPSLRRAAQCVLEGLWQMLSFGMRTSEPNGDLLHLLRFASAVDTELLDVNGRRELLMFQYISSPDTNRLELREAGITFLAAQNLPAALLCLDCYFDNSPRFRNWGLTPEELAPELELFHVFAERLASTMVNAPLDDDGLSKLLGYRKSNDNHIHLPPQSFLHDHYLRLHGAERVHEATMAEIQGCVRDIVSARLEVLIDHVIEDCKNNKAFSLCLSFAQVGYCNRTSCPKGHVRASELDSKYYTSRVRVHLQVVLLLTKLPYNSRYRHEQRRFWLTRLYEAFFPPHHTMGNAASLDIHLLPETQHERVGKIRYWIEGFIYTHKIFPVLFLSLLLRGAILALDAVPSLTTMIEFRSLTHDTGASRYLHRGVWSREFLPPVFRRPSGANSIHDLLFALEASTKESLTKGILALCHVIQNKLMIEISVLCDFLDTLCKNLVLSQFCSRDGRNIHGITLPRSWLMAPIDVDLCSRRNCTFLNLLIRPMAGLLEQIYTGVDAGHLLHETLDLSSPVPRSVRAVFITRICRALALLACNIRSEALKEAVIWTTTSLRRLTVPPPPASVPYGWYVYADTWGGILSAVRRSASGSPMDEMIQLLHPTRLTPNTPLHDFPHVRRVVYDRLENVPNLLRSTESRPVIPITEQSTPLVPEQNGPEEQRPDDPRDEDDEGDEDHTFNAAPPSIPVDDEPEVDPLSEKEWEVLSKLPAIYRKNLWRRRNNGTAMAERRKSIFLSYLHKFQTMPSDKYRKMVLGPLPHLLACLEVLYARLMDSKDKIKDRRMNFSNHVELEELENALTSTNSAIKKLTTLQKSLGLESGIHITRSVDILKRYVQEVGVLISKGLPVGLDTEMQEEFDVGWKGIIKPAYVPPAKPEKPKLNTSDCLELAFM